MISLFKIDKNSHQIKEFYILFYYYVAIGFNYYVAIGALMGSQEK